MSPHICHKEEAIDRIEEKIDALSDSNKMLKSDIKELMDLIKLNAGVLTRLDNIEKDLSKIKATRTTIKEKALGVFLYVFSGILLSVILFFFKR